MEQIADKPKPPEWLIGASMTDEQKQAVATVKRQAPNVLMLVAGIGVLVFGFSNPEQSAELINKIVALVGALMTGAAGLNAARIGHAQKADADKQEIKQEMKSTLPDEIASRILDKLAVQEYRDGEQEKSVSSLLKTVSENKLACDDNHRRTENLVDVVGNHADQIEALWIQTAGEFGGKPPRPVMRPGNLDPILSTTVTATVAAPVKVEEAPPSEPKK